MFSAHRFDGRYAVAVPAWVRIKDGCLLVDSVDHRSLDCEPLERAKVAEAFAHTPRLISLSNGVTLEIEDADGGFAQALHDAGVTDAWVVRMQRYWLVAVFAVAALAAVSVAAYREGLPIAARAVAFALSPRLEARMGRVMLAAFDEHAFKPTRLDRARRAKIAADFARAAAVAAPGVAYRLEFRYGGNMVNAFALPGGIIVLLDATADFGDAIDRDCVLGVLGHELGHVVHKHSTREWLQSLGAASIGSLFWGDFSEAAATVPVALGQLTYSRGFESEADAFSAKVLRARQRSTAPIARFLECLQRRDTGSDTDVIPDFLSTHPATQTRIKHLRALGPKSEVLASPCPSKP